MTTLRPPTGAAALGLRCPSLTLLLAGITVWSLLKPTMGCIHSSAEKSAHDSHPPAREGNRPTTVPLAPYSTFSGNDTTAALFRVDLPDGHPDIAKQNYMFSLLATQSNQISGYGSDENEYSIAQDYDPSVPGVCRLCNNLMTDRCPPGLHPIIRGFLSDFEQAASGGCEICSLILESAAPYTGPGRLKAYINPGLALNIIVKTADKNARYDLFTAIGRSTVFPLLLVTSREKLDLRVTC